MCVPNGLLQARGLFKGWTAHYLRVGPHTILTFVFLEQFTALAECMEWRF